MTAWVVCIAWIVCMARMYRLIPFFTVLYRLIPFSTVVHRFIPLYTVVYRFLSFYTVVYRFIPFSIVLYRIIPFYTVFYRFLSFSTVFDRFIPLYTVMYRFLPFYTEKSNDLGWLSIIHALDKIHLCIIVFWMLYSPAPLTVKMFQRHYKGLLYVVPSSNIKVKKSDLERVTPITLRDWEFLRNYKCCPCCHVRKIFPCIYSKLQFCRFTVVQ